MSPRDAPADLLRQVASVAGSAGAGPLDLAAGVVAAVARVGGWAVPTDLSAAGGAAPKAVADLEVPSWAAGPGLLGPLYEAALAPGARAAGAHYTPSDVAAGVVGLVAPRPAPPGSDAGLGRPRLWDPACGGGAFLLAGADALVAAGHRPAAVVDDLLWGTDVDAGAVAIAEAALVWWAALHDAPDARPGAHLVIGDALLADPPGSGAGFDLVVGNPPFQGQLAGGGVRSDAARAALRARWGPVVGAYTDTAAVFLVAGTRALVPGGHLAMILPMSVLSARDAAAARAAAQAEADLTGLWVAAEPVFVADVDVCAPVLRRRPGPAVDHATSVARAVDRTASGREAPVASGSAVRRWQGRAFTPLPDAPAELVGGPPRSDGTRRSWSALALPALGIPQPSVRSGGRLGDVATAAAGFRDEYYGLVDHVAEAPDEWAAAGPDGLPEHLAPLVTSGLIDPGRCTWGERPVRFAKQRWLRPVVDRRSLRQAGGRAAAWASSTAVAKVVVAAQTRVGEAAVDEHGRWLASTPAVVVHAPVERLWEVAAVICSPVGTAAALAATAGSGRMAVAIKPTVGSVLDLPLPVDPVAWRLGAGALRAGDLQAFATAMAVAYGRSDTGELEAWWWARLPGRTPA